jgi:catechol 2,3-dioxygenase-like lactoylglutathione lyase family enzyme
MSFLSNSFVRSKLSLLWLLASVAAPAWADEVKLAEPSQHPVQLPNSVQLQRATITVSDADASIRFYRDLLGFKVSSDSHYDTPVLRAMFHIPPGIKPRLVLLDGMQGDGQIQPRALGLVAAEGLVIDAQANRLNAPALVLTVTDMDSVHQRLQAAEVETVQAPTELLGFNGKPIGREAMYLDPDGIRIVLFELMLN